MDGPCQAQARALLARLDPGSARVLVLTGAGISAESGIPTFRGEAGYWRVGSRNYRAQELATLDAFTRMPREVWAWYLYRRSVCRAATPNAAHVALAGLERALGERWRLVTQNVDGLHLRAGSSPARTYQIHGNLDYLRCSLACSPALHAVPGAVPEQWPRERALDDAMEALLRCPRCGAPGRPHVLWFDECYDEPTFRMESSLGAAARADLLVVIGTTGQTSLPLQIGAIAARGGAALIVIDPQPNPFTELAAASEAALVLKGRAGEWVAPLCAMLASTLTAGGAGPGVG